jgi:hypothetical protein
MPITIDETTRRITITQDYLTPVSGNLYELDTEDFRTDMNDLMMMSGSSGCLTTHGAMLPSPWPV